MSILSSKAEFLDGLLEGLHSSRILCFVLQGRGARQRAIQGLPLLDTAAQLSREIFEDLYILER